MQRYRITATGAEFAHNELQAHFPNVSFAPTLDADILEHLGLEALEPTPEEIAAQAIAAAQALQDAILAGMTDLFDRTAQSRHYDNRITCALRAGYPGPFHAEGAAFASWMDACNASAYQMLAEVQAGTRTMPATVEEALDLLEPMVWPA